MSTEKYIFESERLGFRNWEFTDLEAFNEVNSDPDVMEHFPNILTKDETKEFIKGLQNHFSKNGYTYYATEVKTTNELIGFIGFAYQQYKTSFTPAIDIGWRLKKSAWGKGYATEGATKCLQHGFESLNFNRVIAVCTLGNHKSENVMKKIGMNKKGTFKHPSLKEHPDYEDCIWYEIKREDF